MCERETMRERREKKKSKRWQKEWRKQEKYIYLFLKQLADKLEVRPLANVAGEVAVHMHRASPCGEDNATSIQRGQCCLNLFHGNVVLVCALLAFGQRVKDHHRREALVHTSNLCDSNVMVGIWLK